MRGLSHENQIENLRPYILALMKRDGRDFTKCEHRGCPIEDGRFEIHHTKYEGATYHDLRIVCRRCNKRAENLLLA